MGLLNKNQIKKINAAFNAVTDTFMRKPITYLQYGESVDPWNENRRKKQKLNQYEILGLIVWGAGKGTDGYQKNKDGNGAGDLSEGYALFNIKDLKAVGMIDTNGNLITKENSDYIVANGEEYMVIGHNLKGPFLEDVNLLSKDVLVKIFIQKQLKNG